MIDVHVHMSDIPKVKISLQKHIRYMQKHWDSKTLQRLIFSSIEVIQSHARVLGAVVLKAEVDCFGGGEIPHILPRPSKAMAANDPQALRGFTFCFCEAYKHRGPDAVVEELFKQAWIKQRTDTRNAKQKQLQPVLFGV